MVHWFRPRLLVRTAVEVAVSSIFGRHADQRLMQAIVGTAEIIDYSSGSRQAGLIDAPPTYFAAEMGDFWIDYAADVGDGWDSAFSVAWLLTRATLPKLGLPAGNILVFGGDQVYPSASRDEYERRLINPYRLAFATGTFRDVFAIPGNHDWYDSLLSFSRIFLSNTRFAGPVDNASQGCETPQHRSYFAIRLPHGWWLLGTDVQLGSDIDGSQWSYFKRVAEQMGEGDRVILCCAEPYWLEQKRLQKREAKNQPSALDRLANELLLDKQTGRSRVAVFLAGDLHHYMHYASDEDQPVHRITAGGGGAFLHPTHGAWPKRFEESQESTPHRPIWFEQRKTFPGRWKSWMLGWLNWLFLFKNPTFGLATAILYVILCLTFLQAFGRWEQEQATVLAQRQLEAIVPDAGLAMELRRDAGEPPVDVLVVPRGEAMERPAAERGERDLVREVEEVQARHSEYIKKPLLTRPPLRKFLEEPDFRTPDENNGTDDGGTGSPTHPNVTARPRPTIPAIRASVIGDLISGWAALPAVIVAWVSLDAPLESMFALLLIAAVLAGFALFSDLPEAWARVIFGSLHGAVHCAAAVVLAVAGVQLVRNAGFIPPVLSNLALVVMVFGIGWIAGSIIMGLYLWLSLNVFGRHWNAGFSSLRIQGWKNFLRMRISSDGCLTIFPIGIEKIPKIRSAKADRMDQALSQLTPELIEKPIKVVGRSM